MTPKSIIFLFIILHIHVYFWHWSKEGELIPKFWESWTFQNFLQFSCGTFLNYGPCSSYTITQVCKLAQDYDIKVVHRLKEGKYIILGRIMFVRVSGAQFNHEQLWILTLWLASNFLLHYHPKITHGGHRNKRNDPQLKKLLIFKQILLVSNLGNVKRTARRICILMLGCEWVMEFPW